MDFARVERTLLSAALEVILNVDVLTGAGYASVAERSSTHKSQRIKA
jgi:hypothetical protein